MLKSGNFPNEFIELCNPQIRRGAFLHRLLEKKKIPFHPIVYEEAYNLYLGPEKANKIITAHYDRVPGTPGANDNTAAVVQLLRLAESLTNKGDWKNTAILLTDLEEFQFRRRNSKQGAFGPALHFAKQDPIPWIFVFDMCGIGDTIVLSKTWEQTLGIRSPWTERRMILQNALTESPVPAISRPLPYSDDLAFAQAGIYSFLFSLLPQDELDHLERWKKHWKMSRIIPSTYREYQKLEKMHQSKYLPPSWRVNHTTRDSVSTIWPDSFDIMEKFLIWISNLPL